MNAQPITTKSTALFGLLLAVSAFNLSALPDHKPTIVTRTISSVDSCDLQEQLNNSETPSAACNITQGKLKGTLKIERRNVTKREWTDDGDKPTVTTKAAWDVTLETECTTGCPVGTKVRLANNQVETLRAAMAAVEDQKRKFSAEAERVSKEEQEKAELAEKKNNCEIGDDGKEFSSPEKALSCKVRRVSKMESREKAAEYFQNEVQPQLQAMISCDQMSGNGMMLGLMASPQMNNNGAKCNADRQKAAAMLQQLGKQGNPYIKQAATNMFQFNQYAATMDQLTMMSRMTQDPQQKAAIQAQLANLQGTAGQYFAQQGMFVNNMRSPMDWDNSVIGFNEGLSTNVQNLNSAYNQLALQHAALLQTNQQNQNALAAAQGRNQRGQGAAAYTGGPSNAPLASAQAQQPQILGGAAAQPVNALNANRASVTTPNIIQRPQFGASVR